MKTGSGTRSGPPPGAAGRIGNALAALVSASARRPLLVLAVAGLLTAGFSVGLTRLQYRTDVLEWLPENEEHVVAFDRLLQSVDGLGNLEVLYLELDPAKTQVTNVTREEAIRSANELFEHVRSRVPGVKHVFGLPHWVMLVNAANHGGDPAHYALPESSAEFQVAWQTAWESNRDLVRFSISNDWRGTWIGLIIDGEPLSDEARRTGSAILEAVASYKTDPSVNDLWKHEYLYPYGFGTGTARIDEQVRSDVVLLGTLAFLFIVGCSLWAFRNVRLVLIALGSLGIGLAITYGLMGWLEIPLSIANVAIVPLLLGVGIDYSIHVLNEYQASRKGRSNGEAFAAMGRVTGIPMLLATFTTAAGLVMMAFSDSPGMATLGLLATFALALIAVLSLTVVPAALALVGAGASDGFRPMRSLARFARFVAARRVAAAVVLLAVTGAAYAGSLRAHHELDMVKGNFPEGDPTLVAGQRLQEKIDAGSLEFVIVEGDVTDPATLGYLRAIEDRTLSEGLVARKANIVSITTVLGFYEILKRGSAGALPFIVPAYLTGEGDARDRAPTTREQIAADLAAMRADPSWAPVVKLLVSEENDVAVIVLVPMGDGTDLAAAQRLWDTLHGVLEAEETNRPEGVSAHVYGYRTITYHFNVFSLKWLRILFAVSLVANVGILLAFTRSARATLAASAPMALGAIWWAGLLPLTGTYVSIFLLFPMIFITSIGSDYAAHLAWRLHLTGDFEEAFATTGRAVWWVMVTDAGAFAIFAAMYLQSATTIMKGASLAILATAAATLTLVPLVFSGKARAPPRPAPRGPLAAASTGLLDP